MTHEENSNLYLADEGKIFRRKSDNFTMGRGIDLGDEDSMENYIEDDMTEDEKAAIEKEKEARMVTTKSRGNGNK